jgi:hypothetical protein
MEGFPLLSRPILACAGVLAALVLAAGPAVAATPSTTATAAPSTTATAAPSTTATTAPPTTAKPVDAKCAALTEQQAIAIKRGTKPTTVKLPSGIDCKALLIKERGLPFPKGAPQTGGGGMAAEVSSWH